MFAMAEPFAVSGQNHHRRPASAHNDRGIAHQMAGELDEAAGCFRRALRTDPDFVAAHCNLGNVLTMQDKPAEAMHCYRETVQRHPHIAQAHYNLGRLLQDKGHLVEAIGHYRQAVQVRQIFEQAGRNLGYVLVDKGNWDSGKASAENALPPNFYDAATHNNLASALFSLARFEEAAEHYEEALKLDPNHACAHWNGAQLRLLLGDLEGGWPGLEWRRWVPYLEPRIFPQPRWDGSIQRNRTVLIHAEGGLGDMVQFIRYAPLVKERVGKVIVDCHPTLMPLLSGAPGIDCLLPVGEPLPNFDVQVSVLSLPLVFRTSLETIPAPTPLHADAELVERWRRILEPHTGFRIGIAWEGSQTGVKKRSIALAQFAELAKIKGVQLISLQKGAGTEQLATVADQFSVLDFSNGLDEASGAFMDTAAIMKNTDLVVSSDSGIIHVAGSLGVPVWVGLPFVPEWRWMLDRQDSPWYPSMRLFRQKRTGDWDGVFKHMADELQALGAT